MPSLLKHTLAFCLLILLSFGVKSEVWKSNPQVFADSAGYLVPALSLLNGRGYGAQENGFRTPTYPLFLAAILAPLDRTHLAECQDAHRAVCIGEASETADGQSALQLIVLVQIALGVLTTALLYALGLALTRNTLVAFLMGAAYALNVAAAYWEISILTETLTTFLLILAVFLTLRADFRDMRIPLLLGLVLGVLALCHSLFLLYWMIPLAFLLLRTLRAGARRALLVIAPVLVIPLLMIVTWSTFNYFVNGFFTPSTLSGYVLIQMVGPVVQNAPEGYDGITQPYVGFRDAMIAETGSHAGAIYRAYPTMMDWTGFTWSEISNKLSALSLYLIFHYPQTYLQVAVEGWGRFWDFALFAYEPLPATAPAWSMWVTEVLRHPLFNVLYWVSLVVLGILFVIQRRSRRERPLPIQFSALLFIVFTILYAAVASSLTNFGDNARYRSYVMPLQAAVIILVLWSSWRTLRTREQRKMIETAPPLDVSPLTE